MKKKIKKGSNSWKAEEKTRRNPKRIPPLRTRKILRLKVKYPPLKRKKKKEEKKKFKFQKRKKLTPWLELWVIESPAVTMMTIID